MHSFSFTPSPTRAFSSAYLRGTCVVLRNQSRIPTQSTTTPGLGSASVSSSVSITIVGTNFGICSARACVYCGRTNSETATRTRWKLGCTRSIPRLTKDCLISNVGQWGPISFSDTQNFTVICLHSTRFRRKCQLECQRKRTTPLPGLDHPGPQHHRPTSKKKSSSFHLHQPTTYLCSIIICMCSNHIHRRTFRTDKMVITRIRIRTHIICPRSRP